VKSTPSGYAKHRSGAAAIKSILIAVAVAVLVITALTNLGDSLADNLMFITGYIFSFNMVYGIAAPVALAIITAVVGHDDLAWGGARRC
jgi:Flp pilus assembly pilin Flp